MTSEDITTRNIPAWYYLTYCHHTEKPHLLLHVHKNFISANPSVDPQSRIVKFLKEDFAFNSFAGDLNGNYWGFNEAFERTGEIDDFVVFRINIPVLIQKTTSECRRCHGSGQDGYQENQPCARCGGSGKVFDVDWQAAWAISASLTVFTMPADMFDGPTNTAFPQPLTLQTSTKKGRSMCPISGNFSREMVVWIASKFSHQEEVIGEITKAMISAQESMFAEQLNQCDKCQFRAHITTPHGWLNISCLGDASGITPGSGAEYDMEHGEGYGFDPHNVDDPLQQLYLVVALAALTGFFLKETA